MKETIYIAGSWKHRHAIELLTKELRGLGYGVSSFIEKATADEGKVLRQFDITDWIESEAGAEKFRYDTSSAITADCVIYVGPSGCDAWAEIGIAWSHGVTILGLWAKGEQIGLMRRLVTHWFDSVHDLLSDLAQRRKDAK